MTGSNEMKINHTTMIEALTYYMQNIVFQKSVDLKIISIETDPNDYTAPKGFIVKMNNDGQDAKS
jgi:hypothetical protein